MKRAQPNILNELLTPGITLLWHFPLNSTSGAASLSGDGSLIAIGSDDKKIYLLNRRGQILWDRAIQGKTEEVAIAVSGSTVLAASGGFVEIFTRKGRASRHQFDSPVLSIAISADGASAVAVTHNGKVYFFNSKDKVWRMGEEGSGIWSVVIADEGSLIAAGSLDSKIYIFDRNGTLMWKYATKNAVDHVVLSASGALLSAGTRDGRIYTLPQSGGLIWLREMENPVKCLSMSANGNVIAAATKMTVQVFTKEGKPILRQPANGQICSLALSADGDILVTATDDGQLRLYGISDKFVWRHKLGGFVANVCLSRDGHTMAVAQSNGQIYIFDVAVEEIITRNFKIDIINTIESALNESSGVG